MRLSPRLAVSAATLALVLAACGSGADEPPVDEVAVDEIPDAPEAEAPQDEALQDDAPDDGDAAPTPDLSVALTLTEVATGGSFTAAVTGPDGVLYVAERSGTVHPVTDGGLGDAVVDLSSETTTDGERGLLGLAFAADGSELYLSSTGLDGQNVVSAVPVDGGTFDDGARRTLYTLDQPRSNHNGGDVAVGPDGMLYVSIGDGGGGGDPFETGQDLTTPLGALLRLDPTGDAAVAPPDNPFVGRSGAAEEIVAYGLRNPYRFSFDEVGGHVWIADVGQNTREEINRVAIDDLPGANFGWNLMEGTLEFAGPEPDDHVPPVYEYDTGGAEGCSVTGGYVYRGEAVPELTGVYLYADFCNGEIRGLLVDAAGEVTEQAGLGIDGGQVVGFARDGDGEVYVLDLGGRLLRIDPA